jgi:hypothetical protein
LLMCSKQATPYRVLVTFAFLKNGIEVGNNSIAKKIVLRIVVRSQVLSAARDMIVLVGPHANSVGRNTVPE